ncbi:putative metalloprotease CJM1_0395 family protein [Hydrogenovibrio sp. 3SP14C1]|uniref:putative metalloprotease CJM1_0395 family protein n=1 Tax=Hydrogenovibrio sp. 3SP14C1 TaxID=3038774 RepID=UPI002417E234|nr:putative metalloprotease CJM1_0395 family protein [Hydrogenovibrio sp. 3SP14C1]MDG4812353.1 putative metalloprotease CJM1_0395 family protein [Hydrogenovibrio sp. 3SP14C1]
MNVSLNLISSHVSSHEIVSQNKSCNRLNTTAASEVLVPSHSQSSALDKLHKAQNLASQPSESDKKVDEKNKIAADQKKKEQEVQQVIQQLKSRDLEVKTHEQAHLAAGGQYVTSGANYVYQTGPDGNRYAIGGDVGIDTSPVPGNPEATLLKAQQIQSAALAPAQPSSQDQSVARAAMQMANNARVELAQSASDEQSDFTVKEKQGGMRDEATSDENQNAPLIQSIMPKALDESSSLISSERQQFNLRVATS